MTATTVPGRSAEDERRRRRAAWPVRRFRLGDEPSDDLSETTTAEGRIGMMWPLALDAFALGQGAGGRIPRASWPVKVRRLGDPGVD